MTSIRPELARNAAANGKRQTAYIRVHATLRAVMGEFVDIASVNELPVGRTRTIAVGDRKIALCRTAKGYFALDNTCPHRGGPLGDGDLIADELICPWHLWGFDVASGMCLGNREVSVVTHEVKIEGDRVLVRLSPKREVPEPL